MSGGSGSIGFMEITSHTQTKVAAVDGSSPNSLKFAAEEAKQWVSVSNPMAESTDAVGVERSCGRESKALSVNGGTSTQVNSVGEEISLTCGSQDDMFSLAELSMGVETTVCTDTVVTSVEEHSFEQQLHIGRAPAPMHFLNEIVEQDLQENRSWGSETVMESTVVNLNEVFVEGNSQKRETETKNLLIDVNEASVEDNSQEAEIGKSALSVDGVFIGGGTEDSLGRPPGREMECQLGSNMQLDGSDSEKQTNELIEGARDSVQQSQSQEESKSANPRLEEAVPGREQFDDEGKHLVNLKTVHELQSNDPVEIGIAGKIDAPGGKELPKSGTGIVVSKLADSEIAKELPLVTNDSNEMGQFIHQIDSTGEVDLVEKQSCESQNGTGNVKNQCLLPSPTEGANNTGTSEKEQDEALLKNVSLTMVANKEQIDKPYQEEHEKIVSVTQGAFGEHDSHQQHGVVASVTLGTLCEEESCGLQPEWVAAEAQVASGQEEPYHKRNEEGVSVPQVALGEGESHLKQHEMVASAPQRVSSEGESHQEQHRQFASVAQGIFGEDGSHSKQHEQVASVAEGAFSGVESFSKHHDQVACVTQVAAGENESHQEKDEQVAGVPGGSLDGQTEHKHKEPYVSPGEAFLTSQIAKVPQAPSASEEISVAAVGLPDGGKQEIISDLNRPAQEELSENVMQPEQAPQDAHILTTCESNIDIPPEGIAECNAEPANYRDSSKSDGMQEEIEVFKGRKVCKRFGKKKFLGEVIGYDPESRWFKVLYEDGDEEELEKVELDHILLPLSSTKASVSHKRRLSTNDDKSKENGRSEKKARKIDMHGTPGKGRKESTPKDKSQARGSGQKIKKPATPKTKQGVKKGLQSSKKSIEKKDGRKKSQVSSTKKSTTRLKQESLKKRGGDTGVQNSEMQHSSVTKKLKYGLVRKETHTKSRQFQETYKKGNKSAKLGGKVKGPVLSTDMENSEENPDAEKEVESPEMSMTEKSEVDTPKSTTATQGRSKNQPGRKRKAGSDLKGELSTVDSKRARKEKILNDGKSPRGTSMQPRMTSGEPKLDLDQEKTYNVDSKFEAKEEKVGSSLPLSTGKRRGRPDRGSVLIGRKVQKEFDGKLYSGQIIGYKLFYKIEYEDGDSEELTWKELESILLSTEEVTPQNKNEEQHPANSTKDSRKLKSKQKKGSKHM